MQSVLCIDSRADQNYHDLPNVSRICADIEHIQLHRLPKSSPRNQVQEQRRNSKALPYGERLSPTQQFRLIASLKMPISTMYWILFMSNTDYRLLKLLLKLMHRSMEQLAPFHVSSLPYWRTTSCRSVLGIHVSSTSLVLHFVSL